MAREPAAEAEVTLLALVEEGADPAKQKKKKQKKQPKELQEGGEAGEKCWYMFSYIGGFDPISMPQEKCPICIQAQPMLPGQCGPGLALLGLKG